MFSFLRPHGPQPIRLPCLSPSSRVCSNSCWSSQWCHPTISSSVTHPLFLLPSIFPSIRVFSNESALHIRWQRIGASASASVLPVNIQDWFPLALTGLISLLFKGLSRVFSSATVRKHQLNTYVFVGMTKNQKACSASFRVWTLEPDYLVWFLL